MTVEEEQHTEQQSAKRIRADGDAQQEEPPAKQHAGAPDSAVRARSTSLPPSTPASSTPNDLASVRVLAAYSEDKGARAAMEDVAVVELDARPRPDDQEDKDQLLRRAGSGAAASTSAGASCDVGDVRCCFAAVFDGHGGSQVARLAAQSLHRHVLAAGLREVLSKAAAGTEAGKQGAPRSVKVDVKAAKAAIAKGFASADAAILQRCAADRWPDGACAVCAWVVGDTVLVANVGDARAVLARTTDKDVGSVKAGQPRALTLSKEHLAVFPQERARIEKAGGYVSADGRLNGRMQVARSFGDVQLKQVGCSATPDVTAFELTPRDQFLLLGCDGFWTAWDPQAAVDVARDLLAAQQSEAGAAGPAVGGGGGAAVSVPAPKAVTNRLLNLAVRERGCKDNCTVMLLLFARVQA